jgi:hypothetical protein
MKEFKGYYLRNPSNAGVDDLSKWGLGLDPLIENLSKSLEDK